MSISGRALRQRGVTLVEQIVFIVVVSVGVVGVLSTLGPSVRSSADPQIRRQQLAISESLLSEILHQPFTFCDPDDPAAISATSAAHCAAGHDQNNGGGTLKPIPADTETRFDVAPGRQFDNVADYAGYSQSNVTNISGTGAVAGYDVVVAVNPIAGTYGLSSGAVLEVAVTVTGGGSDPLTLRGYRFRYAPRY